MLRSHIPLIPWCPSLILDDSNSFPQQWNAMPNFLPRKTPASRSELSHCVACLWIGTPVSVHSNMWWVLHSFTASCMMHSEFQSHSCSFKGCYSSRQRQTTKINRKRASSLSKLPFLFVLLTLTWQPTFPVFRVPSGCAEVSLLSSFPSLNFLLT